jgi:hypothetical protein
VVIFGFLVVPRCLIKILALTNGYLNRQILMIFYTKPFKLDIFRKVWQTKIVQNVMELEWLRKKMGKFTLVLIA